MMRKFASKLLAIDGRTGDGKDRTPHEDATDGSGEESILEKSSVRERLDGPVMSSFRIRSKKIKFTSTGSHGEGGKADVAQAKFKRTDGSDEQVVAVKKLRGIKTIKARKEFINEVEVMAGLSHKNIVQLIGFVEDLEKGVAWIVLSWEPNGNVSQFIDKGDWEIPERVSLIQDTFEGIRYLHTRQPPICHGDLKSLNILVSSSCRAVLTDFGSARAIVETEDDVINDEDGQQMPQDSTIEQAYLPIYVAAAGSHLTLTASAWTLRWAPPEVVKGKRPGLSSDIWAAGWVCWEVMTNKLPFSHLESVSDITLTVIRGRVPSPYEDAQLASISALCSLMKDCWTLDPKVRPDISRCCDDLKWMPSEAPSDRDPSGPRVPSVRLLLQMGQIAFRQASYDEAVSLFKQGRSLARSGGNQTGAALALRLLGNTYRMQSKYPQAEEAYTGAQEIFALTGDDGNRAMTMESMGRLFILRSEFTQAKQVYTQAQEIYTRLGDEHGQAISLSGLGEVYRLQSKYTKGEEFHTQAQELFARVGDDNGRANALLGLGGVYHGQSKYSQAEESYKGAQELYARVGNDIGLANSLKGLGRVYSLQSKHTQAEELVTRAQEICVRLGDDIGRSAALVSLGAIYHSQSKYTQAEEAYTRAKEIFACLGDESGQGDALMGLASVYRGQSKYTQAEEFYTRAEEIFGRLDDDFRQAGALDGLANVCRFQAKYTQAEELFTQAQGIYTGLGDESGLASALNGLGDVHRNQSKYAEAEESYTRALEICTRLRDDAVRTELLWSMGHLHRSQGRNEEARTFYVGARDICTQLGRIKEAEHVSSLLALMFPDENHP